MPRTFIFLFDGTGNDPTNSDVEEPSNILEINMLISESRLVKRRRQSQITFYLPGIGTKFYADNFISKTWQLFFGTDIDSMVFRAYINLTSNYRAGDQIALVGFSRGGIAARLFARLISDFGLLKTPQISYLTKKFEIFTDALKLNSVDYISCAKAYKEEMHKMLEAQPKIDYLGIFDCSGGPFDSKVNNFLSNIDQRLSSNIQRYFHIMSLHEVREYFLLWRLNADDSLGREIWLPGIHSDIGGGYPHRLISKISLLTLANDLQVHLGLELEKSGFERLKMSIRTLLSETIYINKETYQVGVKEDRKNQVVEGDQVHFFHEWLIGRDVYWKGEEHISYKNKFGRALIMNVETKNLLKDLLPTT